MSKASNWLIANLGVVAVFYTRHRGLFAYHVQTRLSIDQGSPLAGVGCTNALDPCLGVQYCQSLNAASDFGENSNPIYDNIPYATDLSQRKVR